MGSNHDELIADMQLKIQNETGFTVEFLPMDNGVYDIYVNMGSPNHFKFDLCRMKGKANVVKALAGIRNFMVYIHNRETIMQQKMKANNNDDIVRM